VSEKEQLAERRAQYSHKAIMGYRPRIEPPANVLRDRERRQEIENAQPHDPYNESEEYRAAVKRAQMCKMI
jgi:hypothetical protein